MPPLWHFLTSKASHVRKKEPVWAETWQILRLDVLYRLVPQLIPIGLLFPKIWSINGHYVIIVWRKWIKKKNIFLLNFKTFYGQLSIDMTVRRSGQDGQKVSKAEIMYSLFDFKPGQNLRRLNSGYIYYQGCYCLNIFIFRTRTCLCAVVFSNFYPTKPYSTRF